ncbi:histidine kinase dimerization/phospho-acceptor domain-containing protein [Bdellovibrio svalbardensis]|uniref:histidine kinase n=1 Tax=Bdellovibrio svalbardensis TaxID=2972972 RepID=A0ABT6DFN7_9BACT|nr:histidine kinase dimerization/phospho-acceptor domain-containing protein [Bdellovibrio svalbardensis]MDG0815319.1 histidine kinase [Bdellovibrio svalbardensis]
MRTLKASFLLIGPWDARLQELGAHIATDLNQAWHWVQDSTYNVVALSVTLILGKKFNEFYEELKRSNPATQFIAVVPNDFSANQLSILHEEYSFFRVMATFQDPDLEAHLFSALEEANQRKQDENLALLIREQTAKLKRLQIELEERVQRRTRFLTEARRKLFLTNSRIEGFKSALMAVHQASSVGEIEQLLNESLAATVQTSWIRVFFHPQDELFHRQVSTQLNFTQLQVPLFRQHEKVGSIFYLRAPDHPFNRDESDFLTRVAEAVALALDRIQKLKESESLKEQWEATFNSMSDPVVLIDANYDIIQSNKAADERFKEREHPVPARKCYQALYNRETPCPGCQRGSNFRVVSKDASPRTFEVYSQSLVLDSDKPAVYVNLYHDVTAQLKMERQILESAKMAELGTIGSSIAHELNNPLGGILSFTQLIKMEMNPANPLYPDVVEMEAGVQRCKEIVQNLLGFTRNPNADQEGDVSLKEVCTRAFKIVELQTKSQGIDVKLHWSTSKPGDDILVLGHLNLLAQALKNLLQNSIDRINDRIRQQKGFKGFINIEISSPNNLQPEIAQILVKDNGTPEKNPSLPIGLGVPVATQILRDHEADLEFFSGPDHENVAKISFTRLVLRS